MDSLKPLRIHGIWLISFKFGLNRAKTKKKLSGFKVTALPRPVRQDRFTLPSNKLKIFIVLWPQSNPLVGNPAGEIQVIGLHSFFYKNEILNVVKIYTVPKLESVMAYIRIYIYIQDLFFFFFFFSTSDATDHWVASEKGKYRKRKDSTGMVIQYYIFL